MFRVLHFYFFLMLTSFASAQVQEAELIERWHVDTLPSSSAHDNRYNEVWGLVNNGREYAVIGSTIGTHIIGLSDENLGDQVAFVAGRTMGSQVIHRDFKTYKNYLYAVCDEGNQSSLQIIDYSTLPDSVSVVYDSKELIRRSHNIYIDSSKAMLYALYTADAANNFKPMKIYSIADPTLPVLMGEYSNIENFSLTNGGVHDAYVRNDTAFLNAGFGGMVIADFADKANPKIIFELGHSDYPFAGYNHSGWPSDDLKYYYMADEDHGFKLKIIDLTNLPDGQVVSTFDAEAASPYSIPHNQVVKGNLLYCSYYFDGLQVWDISNKKQPVRVMHYPTSMRLTENGKYQGAWGVYPLLPSGKILVSDMQDGLFILKDYQQTTSVNIPTVADQISIFPSVGNTYINIDQTDSPLRSVSIYNLSGQLVKRCLVQNQINIESLTNGQYLLDVVLANGVRWKGNFVKI